MSSTSNRLESPQERNCLIPIDFSSFRASVCRDLVSNPTLYRSQMQHRQSRDRTRGIPARSCACTERLQEPLQAIIGSCTYHPFKSPSGLVTTLPEAENRQRKFDGDFDRRPLRVRCLRKEVVYEWPWRLSVGHATSYRYANARDRDARHCTTTATALIKSIDSFHNTIIYSLLITFS